MKKKTILLVDDDNGHRLMLKANLLDDFQIIEAEDGNQVLPAIADNEIDLILLDLKMRRLGGIETLKVLKSEGCYLPVIVITAFSSVDSAVTAMKEGAADYITKPVDISALKMLIDKTLHFERLQIENDQLKKRLHEKFNYGNIIGSSRAMQELFETMALVAPSDATVLIQGESGTGKELVANAIHENSARKKGPFIKLNCAALHENLLESELFGHEKGAFTGAETQRQGHFERASSGTLFLDEIGDMSLPTQAKILRVLQEGECCRLGSDTTIKVDVRLLVATHKDLSGMVERGEFRQDLFFRLNVVPIKLPALRERREDVPALAEHFLRKYAAKNRKEISGIHPSAMNALGQYEWPGNIRELENSLERAVILCLGEQITINELPSQIGGCQENNGSGAITGRGRSLKEMEKELILATLAENKGNKSQTAKTLGITRQTLLNKIKG